MLIDVRGLSPEQLRWAVLVLERELVRLIEAEARLVAEPSPDSVFGLHEAVEGAEAALFDLVDLSSRKGAA